jgi:hypothetical protein
MKLATSERLVQVVVQILSVHQDPQRRRWRPKTSWDGQEGPWQVQGATINLYPGATQSAQS